jgi:beta-lactamase regulating signal transducer with metallopeptidase domain
MTGLHLQTLAQFFTERLLNTALEGLILAGLVWVMFRLVAQQNSGTRFAIWFSALLAIVALPFLAGSGFAVYSRAFPAANVHGAIVLSGTWALYLFAAWGAVAGVLLLRLGVGFWRVHQIRRNCSDVDLSRLDPAISGIVRDFAAHRRVKLCVSGDVAIPAAIGFFRPAIVFPAWLLPQLSPEEIKVILLHELAHLRRRDDWTNLAQKIVKAAFFFHPAVWWIENRLTLEREMACDDLVLAQTASPKVYASSLISFAEKLQNARALTLAQALVSRIHHMSLRVTQILDAKRPSRTGRWKPVLGASAGLLALVLGAAPYAPRLVAFQNQALQNQSQIVEMTRQATPTVTQRSSLAPQARAIPAAFHIRNAGVPAQLKATPRRKPAVMRASAVQQDLTSQEMFVVLQTTRYDASGSGVWTLCIWRVQGGNLVQRQFESAIFVGSI